MIRLYRLISGLWQTLDAPSVTPPDPPVTGLGYGTSPYGTAPYGN